MILYANPYSLDKNLGRCYNDYMKSLPANDDYYCFTDGDAMFTTDYYGHQLNDIVKKHADCGLFTAMTNRVGTKYQCVDGMWHEEKMYVHRKQGNLRYNNYYSECVDITDNDPLSGVLILLRKKEWIQCGGFLEDKMLGVDNSIHYRVRESGGSVKLMKGVYIMHYYRGGNIEKKQHLL